MKKTMAAVLVSVVLAGSAHAETTIRDLAWMAGSWEGQDQKLGMEETWTLPKAGTMLGMHRDVVGDKTVSFEFLRIATETDGIVYWASPRSAAPTAFHLIEAGNKRVVFGNPAHDFPKRILYWLDEQGALHARVEGDGKEKEKAMEWTWTRAKP